MAKYVSVYTEVEVCTDDIVAELDDKYLLEEVKSRGLTAAHEGFVIETTRPIALHIFDDARAFLAKHYDWVKQ